jgi:hypothetical protein
MFSIMAWATSSVAAFHLSVTARCRSSCVIRPSSYWSWIARTSFSYFARISSLLGGTRTSFLEIVTPACVA